MSIEYLLKQLKKAKTENDESLVYEIEQILDARC